MRGAKIFIQLITFLVLTQISISVQGQSRKRVTMFELEFGLGPTFLKGDIGNLSIGGNLGVAGRYRVNQHLALRASLMGNIVFGSDDGSNAETSGFKYYSIIAELTGQLEYWFLEEGRGFSSQGMRAYKPRVRPYLYAGGGPVFFSPFHYHDDAEDLEEFDRYTIMLAAGAGFLYKVNADWLWGIQAGGRLVPSDYLDGSSPASSTSDDNYFYAQFNLVHRF